MVRIGQSLWVVALGLVVVSGCGDDPPAERQQAKSESTTTDTPTTTTTTAAQPLTTTTTEKPLSLAFTAKRTTRNGDAVTITGQVTDALPATESDVDQTELARCMRDPARAVTVRVDLLVDVTSALTADVTVSFKVGGGNLDTDTIIFGFSDGASCEPFAGLVRFKQVEPSADRTFSLWYVYGNALTPNAPNGDPAELGRHPMYIGEFAIAGEVRGADVDVRGPRVCGYDIYRADIVVGGTIPSDCNRLT